MEKIKELRMAVVIVLITIVTIIIATVFISNRLAKISKEIAGQSQVCGKAGRVKLTGVELAAALKSTKDNISRNVDAKFPPARLVDNNVETFAYPNNRQLDYSIDLIDLYPISEIIIVWGEFGEKEHYVYKWYLEGCDESGQQIILDRGNWPRAGETTVKINKQFLSEIRLYAQSEKDWIGIYEVIVK